MHTADELHRQVNWEMEGVRRGVRRYREAAEEADPLTLSPGRQMLRAVCKPLIAILEDRRKEAQEGLLKGGRGVPPWGWPMLLLSSEKLAVITLNGCLAEDGPSKRSQACLVGQARAIARRCRDEVECERWMAEQAQANAEAKRLHDEDHVDLLKALERTYPSLNGRVWARWRTKVKALREEPWEEGVEIALGTMLIHSLVAAAPDKFVLGKRPHRQGFQYVLKLTDEAQAWMRDLRERAEVARPMLLPMIIPPIPWVYPETAPVLTHGDAH